MKRAIIACSMCKKDLEPLLERLDYEADVIWLDENLHNTPAELTKALQTTIDDLFDVDEIILTYLLCGNALLGIKSDNASLRFLKGDDCIYACLCNNPLYKDLRCSSFFLSHSWMSADRSILGEYNRCLVKYGEKRAKRIWEAMYKNYTNLVWMELGEYIKPSEDEQTQLDKMAELANVEIKYVPGSVEMFEKLLSLEPDDSIAIIEKSHPITLEDCKAV